MQSTGKTILVVIDPTVDRQPALERAAWIARSLGAALSLLICEYDQQLDGGRFLAAEAMAGARRALLDRHLRYLDALAAPLRGSGLDVSVDACWQHPLETGVLHKLAELKPLLTVKDTHFHGAVQRALFSNTDWNLIRRCSGPLLLVKPRTIAAPPRILAAVDPLHEFDKPAELDHAILACGTELATAIGGRLEVFHAFDPAPAVAAAAGSMASPIAIPVRELTEALEQTHRAALEALLRSYPVAGGGVHLRCGVAAEQLLGISRRLPADIVIMGAIARSALKRVLIGNTAERVLDRLPCDLLIVKPPGYAAPAA
jgi:universal stress protein E